MLTANVLVPLLLAPKGLYVIEDVGEPAQVSKGLHARHEVVDFGTHRWDRLITIRAPLGGAW